ncbi:transposable element Tc1 transposase [Trichonephila clavipes]|nr:transposable element Tc1 transposase [Trichonephila clavipes]
MSARCPLLRLHLTENHRRLRHQLSDERRTFTMELKDIVFTDESHFCLKHQDGRIQVWRHRGERLLNCCVMYGRCVMLRNASPHWFSTRHHGLRWY